MSSVKVTSKPEEAVCKCADEETQDMGVLRRWSLSIGLGRIQFAINLTSTYLGCNTCQTRFSAVYLYKLILVSQPSFHGHYPHFEDGKPRPREFSDLPHTLWGCECRQSVSRVRLFMGDLGTVSSLWAPAFLLPWATLCALVSPVLVNG